MCLDILDIITFGENWNGRMPHFKLLNFDEIARKAKNVSKINWKTVTNFYE